VGVPGLDRVPAIAVAALMPVPTMPVLAVPAFGVVVIVTPEGAAVMCVVMHDSPVIITISRYIVTRRVKDG
jgi:hypothetical protein